MIEVDAFERGEIRYIKFGRRIVRDARLKEFLESHLNTILQQYAPMLALTDEQMVDDQIGGRAGLELSEAPFQRQRGTLYSLHRRQFLKRHDAYEILGEMRRRIITSRNSLWRVIAKLVFHKHHESFAVTISMRALGRDYQVIGMLISAVREYATKHPEVARALYVSKRRVDLLYPRLLQIQERDEKDEPSFAVETDDGGCQAEIAEESEDVDIDALLKQLDIDVESVEHPDIDNPIGRWTFQRQHLWRDCSLVAPPGMLYPIGMEGLIERFTYIIENIAHSPYAIRYTWEIFGDDENLSAKSLHAKLCGNARLFEFGTSGAYLAINCDQCGFVSELIFDSVAAKLIYGENLPTDDEAALQHFLNSVCAALRQALDKVELGLPQERSLDQSRHISSYQFFRRYWINLRDVTGEVQIELILSGKFVKEIE